MLNIKLCFNSLFAVLVSAEILLKGTTGFIVIDETSGNPKVNVSAGEVEGRLMETPTGARAYVFQGIPYVEPPIGALRFRKPVPKKPWNGTVLCQDYKAACYQNVTISTFDPMSEDCLFMNVFAGVQCTNETLCPILYYVHGGAYEFESPSMFPAEVLVENFATHGIVLISVAYRLGVVGFWSTDTDEAMGNWAMEDMVEGARWMQREAHNFGGDKDHVTIMGHSSSAMAVSLLTMSERTAGLFHQAVFMSGSGTGSFALSNDVTDYKRLAVTLGCASNADWLQKSQYGKIVRCMKTVPVDVLVNKFNEIRGCTECPFPPNPMTSPKNDGPTGLFPFPLHRMISGRRPMPTMTGTTKDENAYNKFELMNATARTVAGLCDDIVEEKSDFKNKRRVSKECKKHYAYNVEPSSKNHSTSGPFSFWTERAEELTSDYQWYAPCFKDVASLRSAGAKSVYLYSFDYVKTGMEGIFPSHAQDLGYIMGSHQMPFDSRDYQIRSRYLPLFVNFIKYGNPTPDRSIDNVTWAPLEGFNYMSVDIPISMKPDYHKSGVTFWNYQAPLMDGLRSSAADKDDQIDDYDKRENQKDVSSNQSETSSSSEHGWRNAFWITFGVLIAILFATLTLSVLMYRKNKAVLSRQNENDALLKSFQQFNSYESLF